MNKDEKYIIVIRQSTFELSMKVNDLIEDGYKPVGGIAIREGDIRSSFYQTMIKE